MLAAIALRFTIVEYRIGLLTIIRDQNKYKVKMNKKLKRLVFVNVYSQKNENYLLKQVLFTMGGMIADSIVLAVTILYLRVNSNINGGVKDF